MFTAMRNKAVTNIIAGAVGKRPRPVNARAQITPERFKAAVERAYADHEAHALKQRKGIESDLELQQHQLNVFRLEALRDGRDPARDERVARTEAAIGHNREQLASIDATLAHRRAQADARIAQGPKAVAELVDAVEAFVKGLKALRPLWAKAHASGVAVTALLREQGPTGVPLMVGMPRHPRGGSLLEFAAGLRDLFGPDTPNASQITRMLRLAEEFGLDV